MAAYILGRKPTPDQMSETGPDTVQSKAQIMEYLKGSFAVLHLAMGAINEGNMLEPMTAAPSLARKHVCSSPRMLSRIPSTTTGRWWNICA